MTGMGSYIRVLVVARGQGRADELTEILERNSCLVTATTSVTTALDIAGYSDFDALVMAEDIAACRPLLSYAHRLLVFDLRLWWYLIAVRARS